MSSSPRHHRIRRWKNPQSGSGAVISQLSQVQASKTGPSQSTVDGTKGAASTSGSTTQALSISDWTGKIGLAPIYPTNSENENIARAQRSLQDSTEKLEFVLRRYSDKLPEVLTIDNEVIDRAWTDAHNSTEAGQLFGTLIGKVLADQEERKSTLPGKISTFMTKLYPIATIGLGVIAFGACAAGFAPVKFAANGLAQVLTLATKDGERAEIVIEGLGKLDNSQSRVQGLRDLHLDETSRELIALSASAISLLVAITDFLRHSLIYLKQGFFRGVGEIAMGRTNVEDADKQLEEAIITFGQSFLEAAACRNLQDGQLKRDDEVLEKLSPMLMDSTSVQEDAHKKRLAGTLEWIIEDERFKKWLQGDLIRLWCSGTAGAGKTILTSRVLDYICPECNGNRQVTKSSWPGLAFIYCVWKRRDEQTALNLIRNIIKQLIKREVIRGKRDLLDIVFKRFLKDNQYSPTPIEKYQELLKSVVGNFQQTLIVIDALDELEGDCQRQELLAALLAIPKLQIFITARESIPAIEESTIIEISSSPIDVESYVDYRIAHSAALSKNVRKKPILRANILDVVERRYSNIFNLVRLLLDHIQHGESPGHVQSALNTAPESLDDFYSQSLSRIQTSKTSKTGLKVLAWILIAKQQLRLAELQDAIAIYDAEPDSDYREYRIDLDTLLECCAGLVNFESSSKIIKFAHLTVEEYLHKRQKEEESPHKRQKKEEDVFAFGPKVMAATACLRYLSLDAFTVWPSGLDESPNDEFEGAVFEGSIAEGSGYIMSRRIRTAQYSEWLEIFPFLAFAARNWPEFAGQAQEAAIDTMAINLLSDNVKIWSCIEIMELAGALPNGLTTGAPSVLRTAAFLGLERVVELLFSGVTTRLQGTPDPEALKEDMQRQLPDLISALLQYRHNRMARLFLEKLKANPRFVDSNGNNYLHHIALLAHRVEFSIRKQMFNLLISNGAKLDLQNSDGFTPLFSAVLSQEPLMVSHLLLAGADFTIQNESGDNLLEFARVQVQKAVKRFEDYKERQRKDLWYDITRYERDMIEWRKKDSSTILTMVEEYSKGTMSKKELLTYGSEETRYWRN